MWDYHRVGWFATAARPNIACILLPGVPDDEVSERFRGWTVRLGSVISDTLLPNMPPGAQLVPVKEAIAILNVRDR